MAPSACPEMTTFPCIFYAVEFLTQPLLATETLETITLIKTMLQTTLTQPSDGSRLNLSFSSTSLPPRPIFAACVATCLPWARWMDLLGGRDFRLIIDPQRVVVIYSGPEAKSFILYSAKDPAVSRPVVLPLVPTTEPQIIPEKFRHIAHANMPLSHGAAIHSAILRSPSGTLAQHLLKSDEEQEAAEIFDLISRSTILSPEMIRVRVSR